MQRTARRTNDDGGVPNQAAILTPEALPMFADPDALKGVKKRRRTVEEHAVFKAMKPLPPVKGLGKGGRLGTSQNSHEVRALVRDTMREEDVRRRRCSGRADLAAPRSAAQVRREDGQRQAVDQGVGQDAAEAGLQQAHGRRGQSGRAVVEEEEVLIDLLMYVYSVHCLLLCVSILVDARTYVALPCPFVRSPRALLLHALATMLAHWSLECDGSGRLLRASRPLAGAEQSLVEMRGKWHFSEVVAHCRLSGLSATARGAAAAHLASGLLATYARWPMLLCAIEAGELVYVPPTDEAARKRATQAVRHVDSTEAPNLLQHVLETYDMRSPVPACAVYIQHFDDSGLDLVCVAYVRTGLIMKRRHGPHHRRRSFHDEIARRACARSRDPAARP